MKTAPSMAGGETTTGCIVEHDRNTHPLAKSPRQVRPKNRARLTIVAESYPPAAPRTSFFSIECHSPRADHFLGPEVVLPEAQVQLADAGSWSPCGRWGAANSLPPLHAPDRVPPSRAARCCFQCRPHPRSHQSFHMVERAGTGRWFPTGGIFSARTHSGLRLRLASRRILRGGNHLGAGDSNR
jgi:hypothetical protein